SGSRAPQARATPPRRSDSRSGTPATTSPPPAEGSPNTGSTPPPAASWSGSPEAGATEPAGQVESAEPWAGTFTQGGGKGKFVRARSRAAAPERAFRG